MSKIKTNVVPQTEIVKIEKENKPIVSKANAFIIKVTDDENKAYDILKEIKTRTAFIEKKRKAITQPLNASLKEVNTMFKIISEPLKEADRILRSKIVEFHERREAAALKRQEKLEEYSKEAEENGDEDKAMELAERADNVEASVGDSVMQKRWTYEVLNIKSVPIMYLMLDTAVVRDAIRNGERNIPGLKIFQESGVRVGR